MYCLYLDTCSQVNSGNQVSMLDLILNSASTSSLDHGLTNSGIDLSLSNWSIFIATKLFSCFSPSLLVGAPWCNIGCKRFGCSGTCCEEVV